MHVCPKCRLEYHDERTTCLVDGETLVEVQDPRIGKLVGGRYQLDAVLGAGGMATVFRAHHTVIERVVAVKLLHPHIAKDSRIRERFLREARSAAALSHPNVIQIYDFGDTEEGVPYLVMELLEGDPLRKLIDAGPLPLPVVFDIAVQLLRGLSRAHDLGIAHRDIKPENAFYQKLPDGRLVAKLVDFGIAFSRGDARLTDIGAIIGTPQYVAPERLRGQESGAPADLYSFGIMMFELLTGRLPFDATTLPGIIAAHLDGIPPKPSSLRPDVPPAIDALVLALLAKEPAQRPVDARAVLDAIELVGRGLGQRDGAATGVDPFGKTAFVEPSDPHDRPTEVPAPPAAPEPAPEPPHPPFATLERWQRRTTLIGRMLDRAFSGNDAPRALVEKLEDTKHALRHMEELRAERTRQQAQIDAIERTTNETRERLGHAVHAVGERLSQARTELRAAEEALENKQGEVADLDYQITILREQLAEAEDATFRERQELDAKIAASGAQIEALRREVGEKTLAVLSAARATPALRPLLLELEKESMG